MAYFTHFKTMGYDVRGSTQKREVDAVTNILQRVRLKLDHVKYRALFAQHIIIDGETPEFLAYTFYGDSTLHWVILYAHQATNPYYDWPLTYHDLSKYVTKKYGVGNEYNTNRYEIIEDGEIYVVDSTVPGAVSVSNFMYEERLNDDKRQLTVIRPDYVSEVVNEFRSLLK
tara:strand:+ start:194 stop:706 length:513 start_codon:yes stop_codon:yes gene_type:complete